MSEPKYRAFLSYSHRDKDIGSWLHRALEHYRIPKRLKPNASRNDVTAARLYPIFKDLEELPTSPDLSREINAALAQSAYLIVICSPASAASIWVNEEILAFKRMGRGNRIHAIIVAGEPNAAEKAGFDSALECFPPALRFQVAPDGSLTNKPAEVVAADARPQGDGKEGAKLKLIAGLLGVGYEELKQRDVEARRARVLAQVAIAATVVVVFLSVVIYLLAGQAKDANAAQFVAEARGALAQRDYARAEIAAAKALTYRDLPQTRELLLTARLGGTKLSSDSRSLQASTMNVFSADSALVASVLDTPSGSPHSVEISSPLDHRQLWRLDLPSSAGTPDAIAFSFASGGSRQIAISWPEQKGRIFRVGIWALIEGKPTGSFRELVVNDTALGRHTKRIPALAFSPTKPWIVTGSEDEKLSLWDVSLDRPKLIWEQEKTHEPNVHVVTFNIDGTLLASGGGDYLAKIWKVSDLTGADYGSRQPYSPHFAKPIYTLSGHSDSVFAIAFSSDGQHFASSGYDRTIREWDFSLLKKAKDGSDKKDSYGATLPQTVATMSGQEGTILTLSYSDDGSLLTSGAADGSVNLWDAASGRQMQMFKPDNGTIRSVVMTMFDNGVYIGGENGWSVWSVRGGSLATRLWNGGATVGAITFDPTGEYLAAGGGGNTNLISVWDRSYKIAHQLDPELPDESFNGIAFSPDGRWITAGGAGNVIHVWDRRTKDWQKITTNGDQLTHGGAIWGLCFDPQGRWMASSNERPDVQIKRWNLPDWTLKDATPSLPDSVYGLACDTSGKRIFSGDSRARVALFDTMDLHLIDETINVDHDELNVWSLALSDTPHAILSGNSDGHVYRWIPHDFDPTLPEEGAKLPTSPQDAKVNPTINSVAFEHHHGLVAAAGVGPSVELYSIGDLHHLRSLRGHQGTIWWVTFDLQGTRLAYGGLDGVVRVVNLDEMERLDSATPAELYAESQKNTGLIPKP